MCRIYIYIITLLFFFSCQDLYHKDVQYALEISGNNRFALEKLLNHYKGKNKKKYEAACFLIANMPYHESINELKLDANYEKHFVVIDSLYNAFFGNMKINETKKVPSNIEDSIRRSLGVQFDAIFEPIIEGYNSDVETITFDFLLDNIETAFLEWETNPLLKKMDFDTFKEFILPYRSSREMLQFKRSEIRKMFKEELSKEGYGNICLPVERYKTYIGKCRWLNKYTSAKGRLGLYDLMMPKRSMDCLWLTTWSCNVLRACGIPAVFEYNIQWKDKDRPHHWSVSPDSTGHLVPFDSPDNNLFDFPMIQDKAGKVYRKTFGANKNTPYFIHNEDEYIPEELNSPLLKDETFRYHQSVTLRIPFKENTPNKLAYLCFFNRNEMKPVAWGVIDKKNNEVVFEQLPLNTQFFPAYYVNDQLQTFGDPFILLRTDKIDYIPVPHSTNEMTKVCNLRLVGDQLFFLNKDRSPKEIRYFPIRTDEKNKQTLCLTRKYQEKDNLKEYKKKLVGGVFLGGHDLTGNFDTLYTILEAPQPYLQEYYLNNKKSYRYYKFKVLDKVWISTAILEFLGLHSRFHHCECPTLLPVFCTHDNNNDNYFLFRIMGKPFGSANFYPAFDGNMETYATGTSIGMDFITPVNITHIRFAPRNANNIVERGCHYKLWYYDNNWVDAGVKVAENNFITYEDIPSGTLYWLQNLDKGNEERPFFYVSGKQYFLHVDDARNPMLQIYY